MTAGPARRAVLAVGALVLLGGCSGEDRATPPPRRHPEVRLRARVADEVDALVVRYEATLAAHPALAPVLTPLLAEHRAHVAVLRPPPDPGPGAGTPAEPSSSPAASASAPAPAVPSSPAAALAAVVAAEIAAAARRRQQAAVAPPASARLLASVGAAGAAHAALLRRVDA